MEIVHNHDNGYLAWLLHQNVFLLRESTSIMSGNLKGFTLEELNPSTGLLWLSKWCKIQHFKILFIFVICSKFNTYIYIQQFYFLTKLSIQKLFIHSTTFYSFKIYCASLLRMEVTYFLQRMNRGQRRSASDHWNFEKYTDCFCTEFSEERLRRSKHLRLCLITLRRCSIDCLQIFFASSKLEKIPKKCCTQSEKLMVSLTL